MCWLFVHVSGGGTGILFNGLATVELKLPAEIEFAASVPFIYLPNVY